MPERTVFKGRDGRWHAVEETACGAEVRIEIACLGSTEELARIEQAAGEANAAKPAKRGEALAESD